MALSLASVWGLWSVVTEHTTELYHVFNGSTEDVLRTFDLANYYLDEARSGLDDPARPTAPVLEHLDLLLGRKDVILSHARASRVSPEFYAFIETHVGIFHQAVVELRGLIAAGPLDEDARGRAEALIFAAEDAIGVLYTENDLYIKNTADRVKNVLDSLMVALLGFAALLLVLLGGIAFLWRKSRIQEGEMKELALRDPLTGLHNRRYFDEVCAPLLHGARRSGQPFGLIALDVDHFKPFNDTYGHSKGDAALIRVAEVLRAAVTRKGDLAFRLGGEEFCCLLPNCGRESLLLMAERIRVGIKALGIAHGASPTAPCLTASLGVAEAIIAEARSPAELYAFADKALYRAKRAGRNRVQFFSGETVDLASPERAAN